MRNVVIGALLLFSISMFGQEGRVIFNYNPSVAMGSANDFISSMSWRGSNLDFRFEVADNIEVGAIISWNYLYERKDRAVYSSTAYGGTVDVSAVQSRYLNIIPLTAQGFYYFKKEDQTLWPYAGLNIGAYSVDYEKYWGNILDEEESWNFGFAPSVGVLLPVPGGNVSINAQARYNFVAFSYEEINNISYFDFNLGLSFDL